MIHNILQDVIYYHQSTEDSIQSQTSYVGASMISDINTLSVNDDIVSNTRMSDKEFNNNSSVRHNRQSAAEEDIDEDNVVSY